MLATVSVFDEAYGLVVYCSESPSIRDKIVWFEDLYPNHVPAYTDSRIWDYLVYFTAMIEASDIQERLDTLYNEVH